MRVKIPASPVEGTASGDFPAIPEDLKQLKRWAVADRRAKIPHQPNGTRAESDNPETWVTYREACDAIKGDHKSVLLFAVTPELGILGVDIDGCMDAGKLKKWATPYVKLLRSANTYFELSPSESGLRAFIRGTLNTNKNKIHLPIGGPGDHQGVEVFRGPQFLSITSNKFRRDIPSAIAPCPELIKLVENAKSNRKAAKRVDAQALTQRARQLALTDGRNNTGLWLACQLRDNGYSKAEAQPVMESYVSRVHATNAKGESEPYTNDEAMASLRQAYSRPPREPWDATTGSPQREGGEAPDRPRVLTVRDVMAIRVEPHFDLIQGWFPSRGASLIFGKPKSNKTLLSVQAAIAVASGKPFLDHYPVSKTGPVLILAQDDPDGGASVREIFTVSPISVKGLPIYTVPSVPFTFGSEFIEWLEQEIVEKKLIFVVLDSYTKLRGSRNSGVDIVKAESKDLTMLDELAKRTDCSLVVIHHPSKGSAALDWHDQPAGTYAMGASTENQIHISRFTDFLDNAPERLVRIRGRHTGGRELVIRFRQPTLDQEFILEGGAAPLYPLLRKLQAAFPSKVFGPKDLQHELGYAHTTAYRNIERLLQAGVIRRVGYGSYEVWTNHE